MSEREREREALRRIAPLLCHNKEALSYFSCSRVAHNITSCGSRQICADRRKNAGVLRFRSPRSARLMRSPAVIISRALRGGVGEEDFDAARERDV